MYNFSYFKEEDKKVLLQFIEEYPFALLTGSFYSGKQVATQIPVLVEEKNGEFLFHGHIMRNTDHYKAFTENSDALLVFTGPNCYVSASWYDNPRIGSTWNYMSVHVSGKLKFMSNEELVQFMRKLTLKYEKDNPNSPTYYDNLPNSFLNKMMPAIAGFTVRAKELDNIFKLSQNRDKKSYLNIISKLNEVGGYSQIIADEMAKRQGKLFPEGVEWDPTKFDS